MKQPTPKEKYQSWREQYEFCVQSRQGIERRWRRWYNIVDDNIWAGRNNSDGSPAIEVNELGSIIETIIPNIILHPGKVEVRAIHQEDVYKAVIYEYIGKYLLSHYNIKEQFMKNVYDSLVLGDSLIKVGYWLLPLVHDAQWKAGLSSTTTESAFALHTPLFEFYPDYHVNDWSLQRFYIHQVYKHIDEFTDNSIYDQKQVSKLKPDATERDIFDPSNDMLGSKKEYIKVQEVHNLVKAEMYVMAYNYGCDGFLMEGQETYPLVPFEHLSFFPRPMNIWGTSISQRIERHLIDLSRYHSGLNSVMRKLAVFKLLFDSTKIKHTMAELLKSANDSVIAITGPPAGVIESVDLGISNKQFVFDQAINLKNTTIREMSGVPLQSMGIAQPGVDSAYEVATLQKEGDVKNKMRLNVFEDFAKRVIEKLIYIVSVEYTPDRIAKMTGVDVSLIEQLMEPYDPGRYLLEYGESAVGSSIERRNDLQWLWQSPLAQALNPVWSAQMAADVLGLEYTDTMILPGSMMGGNNQPQGGESAQGVSTPGNRNVSSGQNNSQTTRRGM